MPTAPSRGLMRQTRTSKTRPERLPAEPGGLEGVPKVGSGVRGVAQITRGGREDRRVGSRRGDRASFAQHLHAPAREAERAVPGGGLGALAKQSLALDSYDGGLDLKCPGVEVHRVPEQGA